MSKKIRAIFFDLDGTLIETVSEIALATNDTLMALGDALVSEDQVRHWIGHGTKELLISALAYVRQVSRERIRELDILTDAFKKFDSFYLKRCGGQSYLYPSVREVLLRFKNSGIKMALITNKESQFTRALMQAHQIEDFFELVICGDTLSTKKPDPMGIKLCMDRLGVAAQESVFVGDSSVDAQTARNANLRVWLMNYGYNMGEPLQNARPDHIALNFNELLKFVE